MVLTLPFTGLEYKLFFFKHENEKFIFEKIVDLDFPEHLYTNNISINKRMRLAVVVVLKFYLTL